MIVNENLVLNSNQKITTEDYELIELSLSESLQVGESYTITVYGEFNEAPFIQIFNSVSNGGSFGNANNYGDKCIGTFVYDIRREGQVHNKLILYNVDRYKKYKISIDKIKLEEGNQSTVYIPNNSDINIENNAFSVGGGYYKEIKSI
ncbi:hypothetical protein [uncultured Anaerococcus sp.]|uniref:hypothetical protein n=1 Tax=uncultured Anaerococcus sp. TaxID=293428 RepID=UPI00261ACE50|nr:hypothetical protein [uncultured Anaerococcus sp.]